MFSFFRRGKKDADACSSNGVAHVVSKRHDTFASSQPTCAQDENSSSDRSQSQEVVHHVHANTNNVGQSHQAMAPMAAARGKGKAKKNAKKEQNQEKQQSKEGKKLEQGQKSSNQQPVVTKSEEEVIKTASQVMNQTHPRNQDVQLNNYVNKQNSATQSASKQSQNEQKCSNKLVSQQSNVTNEHQCNQISESNILCGQKSVENLNQTEIENLNGKTDSVQQTNLATAAPKKQSIENLKDTIRDSKQEESSVVKPHRQPLSYSKILQRLDSVPPMTQSQPQPPEKRRHSVKPCSHVTMAASSIVPSPNAALTPPGSPVAAARTSRLAKQSKTDQEVDTVTASIKLHIDMPTITNICPRTEVKNDLGSAKDSDKNVKQDIDKEKRNLVNQETQFQTQLTELSERLRSRESEASELRIQMETLKQELYVKSTGVDRLQAELSAAHKDSESVRQRLKHVQEEVQDYKQKNVEMVDEIQRKTDEYKSLEQASKDRTASLETAVKDLTEKLSNLESQISSIREERDRLEKRRAELESEREEEKRIVQEALDAATSENETIRRRWEQDFEKLRTVNTDREQQMLDDFEWKLREVQAACKKRLEEKDKQIEIRIKEAQKDVDKKVKEADAQMNEVKHLRSYEAEVTQLRGLTHEQQHCLRTLSTRVEKLQASEESLKEEINNLHAAIETEKQKQILLIHRHEKDLADKERALQIRLEKQRDEVSVQWEQKLRQECARLSAELEQMHNEDQQLAIELVKVQKDREFESLKEQWERKLQLSLEEIEDLRNTLSRKDDKHQLEIDRLRTNADRDIVELRRELDKSEMAFHEKTEKLLEEHEKEIDKINEEAERRLKELEQNSQMQMSSMRTTLELVKEQAAREADERIQKLQNDHQRIKDELWQRLTDEKEKEMLQIEQEYKAKFEKIKEQFTIVQKSHQNKEQDLVGKIKNLTGEITDKSSTIESLQNNVDTLQGGVQVLRQEIIHQDQTLNKVKVEAEQKIGELQHALKVERDTLQVEREEHIEEITHIQKQAQTNLEQLQRRCQCLTKLFEDMRSRYDKRESRPEDLNLITNLRAIIAEQERDLALLNEEKRYFQMKLMKHSSSEEENSSPATPQWKDGEENLSNSEESLESSDEEIAETIEQTIPG